MLEFIGRLAKASGPDLMFRRWVCPLGPRSGATLTLGEDSSARGAGTDLLLNYKDVWPNVTATRAFVEQDLSTPRGSKGITRILVREVSQLAPVIDATDAPQPSAQTPAQLVSNWLKDNNIA